MTLKDVENLISNKIQCSDSRWMEHLKHIENTWLCEEAAPFDGYIAYIFINDVLSHLSLTEEQKEYVRNCHYPFGEVSKGFSIHATLCYKEEEINKQNGNKEALQELKKTMEHNARIGIIEEVAKILETAHQKPLDQILFPNS